MERPMSKKTNEPPKRPNHKGNIKFPDPLHLQRGGPLERMPSLDKLSPTATTCLKIKTIYAHYNITNTPSACKMRTKLKE
jgi:hypothetical protein